MRLEAAGKRWCRSDGLRSGSLPLPGQLHKDTALSRSRNKAKGLQEMRSMIQLGTSMAVCVLEGVGVPIQP